MQMKREKNDKLNHRDTITSSILFFYFFFTTVISVQTLSPSRVYNFIEKAEKLGDWLVEISLLLILGLLIQINLGECIACTKK